MLAIAGGKGGSGKTTTTACLARAFADTGGRPIAVDGDCDMPDLHLLAGTPAEPGMGVLADGADLPDVTYQAVELPGVDVLPAGCGDVDALQTSLSALGAVGRQVLVDTPAGASPVVAATLRAADAVVVVSTPTRESLEDAAKTAAMARQLGTQPVGSILTRSDGSVDPTALLDCETLVHVPDVSAPMSNQTLAKRYESAVKLMNKRNV